MYAVPGVPSGVRVPAVYLRSNSCVCLCVCGLCVYVCVCVCVRACARAPVSTLLARVVFDSL